MHYIDYFFKLFKRLNIKMKFSECLDICTDDQDFYNEFYLLLKNNINLQEYSNLQKRSTTRKIKYKFEGHMFTILEVNEPNIVAYSIHLNDIFNNHTACLVLFINLNENFVYIENISYYPNRIFSGMLQTTKDGSLLFKTALSFIRTNLMRKYKLKYIRLRDTGFIYCKQTKTMIEFDNFYMLTHGHTWYGRYGFVPFDPVNNNPDVYYSDDYNANQKLVNIKVKDTHLREYVTTAIYKLGLYDKFPHAKINELFRRYANKSIKNFMSDFVRKYDRTYEIFELIYKELMRNLKMVNLHGKAYFLLL